MLVGVIYNGEAMMPCCPARARRLIASREATPFIHKGVFCIRLNRAPSDNKIQPVTIGVDPGSKKEGLSVTTQTKTVLNIQLDAVTWVKDALYRLLQSYCQILFLNLVNFSCSILLLFSKVSNSV